MIISLCCLAFGIMIGWLLGSTYELKKSVKELERIRDDLTLISLEWICDKEH